MSSVSRTPTQPDWNDASCVSVDAKTGSDNANKPRAVIPHHVVISAFNDVWFMVAERSGNAGFFRIGLVLNPNIYWSTPKLTHPLLLIKYIIDNLLTGQLREFPSKSRFFYRLAKGWWFQKNHQEYTSSLLVIHRFCTRPWGNPGCKRRLNPGSWRSCTIHDVVP